MRTEGKESLFNPNHRQKPQSLARDPSSPLKPAHRRFRAAQNQLRRTHYATSAMQTHFALTQRPAIAVQPPSLPVQPSVRAIQEPLPSMQPVPRTIQQPFNPTQAPPRSMQTPSRAAQAPSNAKQASLPEARVSPPAARRQWHHLSTMLAAGYCLTRRKNSPAPCVERGQTRKSPAMAGVPDTGTQLDGEPGVSDDCSL